MNSSTAGVSCEKCKKAIGKSRKFFCVAFHNSRVSQEEFFNYPAIVDSDISVEKINKHNGGDEDEGFKLNHVGQNTGIDNVGGLEGKDSSENGEDGELILKRSRDKLLEEARDSVPEPGSGRVMHLVKAFENLRLIRKVHDSGEKELEEVEDDKKGTKWALTGLQQYTKLQHFNQAFCWKRNNQSNGSSGTFARRNYKRKPPRSTSQRPFTLRIEQRGRCKEKNS